MPSPRLYLHYGILSGLCFLAATNGFEILASVMLTEAPTFAAALASFHRSLSQPVGSLLLALPFFAVGILAANLAKDVGSIQAKVCFIFSVMGLGALYLSGYWAAQQALVAQKWTAAALSVGVLPVKSIFVLMLAGIVASLLFWWAARGKT